jgi:hypothetical protein
MLRCACIAQCPSEVRSTSTVTVIVTCSICSASCAITILLAVCAVIVSITGVATRASKPYSTNTCSCVAAKTISTACLGIGAISSASWAIVVLCALVAMSTSELLGTYTLASCVGASAIVVTCCLRIAIGQAVVAIVICIATRAAVPRVSNGTNTRTL